MEQQNLLWTNKKSCSEEEVFELMQNLIHRTWYVDNEHINLYNKGWRYGFNNRKRALGVCKMSKKRIELSLEWIKINNKLSQDFEDVIRHEIAHAIDYCKRGKSDHSLYWKKVCVQVGANPERLYNNKEAEIPLGKYTLRCNSCGHKITKHRKPKRRKSCGKCCNRFNPEYELEVIQNY